MWVEKYLNRKFLKLKISCLTTCQNFLKIDKSSNAKQHFLEGIKFFPKINLFCVWRLVFWQKNLPSHQTRNFQSSKNVVWRLVQKNWKSQVTKHELSTQKAKIVFCVLWFFNLSPGTRAGKTDFALAKCIWKHFAKEK